MAARVDLLDVNVWLALGVPDHAHHAKARHYWFDEAGEQVAFCRVTALGFLRLSTTPAAMGGQPYTTAQAWQAYAAFRAMPEVRLADEPEGCEPQLATWATQSRIARGLWTDAYLAAFAQTAGWRLVSFDRDFARFDGLHFFHLVV